MLSSTHKKKKVIKTGVEFFNKSETTIKSNNGENKYIVPTIEFAMIGDKNEPLVMSVTNKQNRIKSRLSVITGDKKVL